MTHAIVKKNPFSEAQLALIKSTVARGATNDELKLFLYTAGRCGLDPLVKQIHFVKRKTKQPDGSYADQMAIQTGIDGYRAIAERTGEYAGSDDATYDSEDSAHPNRATVSVYRIVKGERSTFTASARWSEFAPSGAGAFMWTKMPYHMLAKVAEALALRKAFPNDLSGLFTDEEMQKYDEPREAVVIEPKNPMPPIKVKGVEKIREENFTPGIITTDMSEVKLEEIEPSASVSTARTKLEESKTK